MAESGIGRTVLVVWGSADWPTLHPHIDAGRMPNLQRLIERGAIATIASAEPLTRETLMTTLATGVLPDQHGVLGFLQVRADGGGVEASGHRSWRVPAVWERLEAAGVRTMCVNWPATAPADRWPGVHVDERFATASGAGFDEWAAPPHSVSPERLVPELLPLRLHPADPLGPEVAAFVPRAAEVPGARLGAVATMLARVGTVHGVATHLAARRDWDVLFVRYELLTEAKLGFQQEPEDGPFGQVLQQACALLDLMLGRLLELAGEATVLLVSPNGLSALGGAGRAHPRGMLAAAGPGIAADTILPGARLVDIAPTLLARYGFALACDGTRLTALAEPAPTPAPTPAREDDPAGPDFAAELLALGYADPLTAAQQQAMVAAEATRLVNLGITLMGRGRLADAAQALEAALVHAPRDVVALHRLARCRVLLGEYDACLALGRRLLQIDPLSPRGHLMLATWCAMGPTDTDPEPYLVSARELGVGQPEVLVRIGGLELLRDGFAAAAADFAAALAADPTSGEAAYGSGVAHLGLNQLEAAETWLRRAIVLEHNQPLAYLQLGTLLVSQGRAREAVGVLETALAQSPAQPAIVAALERAREELALALTTKP